MSRFYDVYLEELQKAVDQHPEEYPWAAPSTLVVFTNVGTTVLPNKTVQEVADQMWESILVGRFNKDGRAIKATCKRLKIKHTYTAIRQWVQQEEL